MYNGRWTMDGCGSGAYKLVLGGSGADDKNLEVIETKVKPFVTGVG